MGNFFTSRFKKDIEQRKKRPAIEKKISRTIYPEERFNKDVQILEPEFVKRINEDYLTYKGTIYRIYHD